MAKTCPILDAENLRGVFNKIMQKYQLNYQDIKTQDNMHLKYVADRGQFNCESCCHKWESNFSWITFDLSEMKITYRWKMKCKYCMAPWQPTFTMDQVKAMFEKAVRMYKGEPLSSNVNVGNRVWRERPQPHIPELCEKCRWGFCICWHRRNS